MYWVVCMHLCNHGQVVDDGLGVDLEVLQRGQVLEPQSFELFVRHPAKKKKKKEKKKTPTTTQSKVNGW